VLTILLNKKKDIFIYLLIIIFGAVQFTFVTNFEWDFNLYYYFSERFKPDAFLPFWIIFNSLASVFLIITIPLISVLNIIALIDRKSNSNLTYLSQKISITTLYILYFSLLLSLFSLSFIDIEDYPKVNKNIYDQLYNLLIGLSITVMFPIYSKLNKLKTSINPDSKEN